jgi:hypothetical protein
MRENNNADIGQVRLLGVVVLRILQPYHTHAAFLKFRGSKIGGI